MRKKKMTISNQSEDVGGAAELKPPDASWFNHQTNWKYFGRQILCQVSANKFHVHQCQAQKTLDIWPCPVCHLTIIWPWTLLRKCHISPEIHLNFSWRSPNHLTFPQLITNPISGSSLRLDVWNEKWPWAWQCGEEIYVYDSGIWKTESRHWHRSWIDQTEAGAESSFNCSSRQCWVETQWIKRRSLWHLDRSLFWIFLRWMIDTKMFYRLRDKSI